MSQIILLNKPYNVLCQFSDNENRQTLKDIIPANTFPDFYPAGRLDYDSEGLVVLTDNGQLQQRIANPKNKFEKTYWVQVEGEITESGLESLRKGLDLKDGLTQPAKAERMPSPDIWERNPPIRSRQHITTQWLSLSITEGKNRQVRRMTAAIGNPTLRLIRYAIGPWTIKNLPPGNFKLDEIHLPKNNIKRPIKNKRATNATKRNSSPKRK